MANKFVTDFKKLRQYIHKLISLRNKIFHLLKQIHSYTNDEELYLSYSKEDYVSLCTFWSRFKYSKHTDAINLWDLPKRNNTYDVYENNELSE